MYLVGAIPNISLSCLINTYACYLNMICLKIFVATSPNYAEKEDKSITSNCKFFLRILDQFCN